MLFTTVGSTDEVPGSVRAYIQYRIHIPVCNLFPGRADAEHGILHGIIQSILYGRKTCRSNLDRFNGESKTIQGTVEYVTYENNKAYVSIGGTKYSAEDVTAVISEEYQSSYDLAVAFCVAMNKLPGIDQLTYGDKETVETLKKGYEAMTTYQKSFVPDDYATKLQKYVERMEELVKEHDRAQENAGESGENGENADKTQEA